MKMKWTKKNRTIPVNLGANNTAGFTLLELLVSMGILTLITGLFFSNYKSANQRALLDNAALQLAADLRLIQSYALSAKKNEKNGNTVPRGGWGIRLRRQNPNNSFYILFADAGDNSKPQEYDNSDFIYRQIDFPKDKAGNPLIEIDEFTNLIGNPDISIVILPPAPEVYFTGQKAGSNVGVIRLRDVKTDKTKNIMINSFGLIDVE